MKVAVLMGGKSFEREVSLASGKVDIVIAGMTADDERRKEVDFSEPYYNASQVIIVRK